jgi:flagellum-specific peptidoglycan hydrolase FlgJ
MKSPEIRLNEVAQIAVRLEKETGCPAQLLIAQWAIESKWGEKPVGHANYFGTKRAACHTQWCAVTTHEVFTPAQLETWNHQHTTKPARLVAILPDSSLRVEIHDGFAGYDSLDASCQDYAWLITNGAPYHAAWEQYQKDRDLPVLIPAVARVYATDPGYAHLAAVVAGQANVKQAIAQAVEEETSKATRQD